MTERLPEANPETEESSLNTALPDIVQIVEPSDMLDTTVAVLAAGAVWEKNYNFLAVDGFLIYVAGDIDANAADVVIVTNGRKPALAVTDRMEANHILTPGKGITIPMQDTWISLRNVSANSHTVVVEAFRGRQPYFS